MISSSGILSTGEKKCSPMKSAGRDTPSARPVIGRVEVLEPSRAPSAQERLDLGEDLRLDGRVLEDGLDHEVGALRRPRRLSVGVIRRQQGVGLLLRGAAPRDGLVDEGLGVALAAVGRLLRDVLEHDLDAGLGAHVRDRGAHHARAEHDDLLGLEAARCPRGGRGRR